MAIEIKQSMRLSQQLVVTPQLQQAIRLLQLSRLELSNVIQKELLENPVLEEQQAEEEERAGDKAHGAEVESAKEKDKGHEHSNDEVGSSDENLLKEPANFDWENYLGIYNAPGIPTTEKRPAELPSYETTLSRSENLQEHLIWQLHLSVFSDREVEIGNEIIGNINDDGYFIATIDEIAERRKASSEEVEAVLKKIQEFDPSGVAARDLRECLRLQVELLGKKKGNDLIIRVINDHLTELEFHNYSQIAKKLKISVEEVRHIADFIRELDPKPGRPYSPDNAQYITPDVYVQKLGDEYVVTLNEDGLPKLQVSSFYRRTMMKGEQVANQTKEYINDKMRQAMWLIKSIHQRQRTLYKVAKSIIKFQMEFLDKGIDDLRPMVLKDVAEDIDMHESTISRVTTNKYMHTPRGIFELKYFFSSGVKKTEGEDIAAEAVKSAIQGIVEGENRKKPFSDQDIAEKLKDRDILIARRTVAKYREALRIPPSSKRRRFE